MVLVAGQAGWGVLLSDGGVERKKAGSVEPRRWGVREVGLLVRVVESVKVFL
jgi:hypothetical protein